MERCISLEEAVGIEGDRSSEVQSATLAAIVESSNDAIISKTLDGIITTWNKAAERLYGYSPDEAIGQSILMLIPIDRAHEATTILNTLRRGERIENFETVRITKSRQLIDVSLTCSPIKDHCGRIIGASKILRDITAQKQAEATLRQQEKAMEHLARLNTAGEMATGLAHELNQPLTSILNYAVTSLNLARSEKSCPEKVVMALEEVVSETRRASEIIRRMRNFIRKRDPRCEPVDLNSLVQESLHLMENDLKLAKVDVRLKLARNLPSGLADPVQFVQVMVNLLRNALDAMLDPAAEARELQIISSGSGHCLQVDVVDRGCGVGVDQLDGLFDHFLTTKPNGLGLGLAISKTIIESLGGRLIGTRNSKGGGMTFSITLRAKNQGEP